MGLTFFWYLTELFSAERVTADRIYVASKELLSLICDCLVFGSTKYFEDMVEPTGRSQLLAACPGPGSRDRLLKVGRECGGCPMSLVEFPYTQESCASYWQVSN